jgi:HSP20 family protein
VTNKGFDLSNMRQSINRVVEDALSFAGGNFSVPLDIYETAESIVILTAPLTGIVPEKLDVSISGDHLIIVGETTPDTSIPEKAYLRRERRYGHFSRKVQIPRAVNADAATAELKESVLRITLPKLPETRSQPKVIHVTPADQVDA